MYHIREANFVNYMSILKYTVVEILVIHREDHSLSFINNVLLKQLGKMKRRL